MTLLTREWRVWEPEASTGSEPFLLTYTGHPRKPVLGGGAQVPCLCHTYVNGPQGEESSTGQGRCVSPVTWPEPTEGPAGPCTRSPK